MLNLKPLAACLEDKAADGFLELLLDAMSLLFRLDRNFRRNIEGFEGRYLFRSQNLAIQAGAVFSDGSMSVKHKAIDAPDIAITFRDDKALMSFLLTPKPDILGAMLRQDVVLAGNLNYLYKFAYMAKRLQLMATGKV